MWRKGAKHAVTWLREQDLPYADLVELLGASETSIRRWADPDEEAGPRGEHAERAVIIAKIVNHLRHAMTPLGAVQWLRRAHPDLDDRRPLDQLKDFDSYQHLIHLASGVRSFVAT